MLFWILHTPAWALEHFSVFFSGRLFSLHAFAGRGSLVHIILESFDMPHGHEQGGQVWVLPWFHFVFSIFNVVNGGEFSGSDYDGAWLANSSGIRRTSSPANRV